MYEILNFLKGWLYIKIFEKFNLVTINKYFKQQNNENVNN